MTLYGSSHSSSHVVIICLLLRVVTVLLQRADLVASYTDRMNCSISVIKHCQLCTPETSNVVIIACSFSKCHP